MGVAEESGEAWRGADLEELNVEVGWSGRGVISV